MVNPPKKGTTKEQFNRNFLNRVFYHYRYNTIRPCIIYSGGYYNSIYVDVRFFNSEWVLSESISMVTWELLFESYQEAAKYDKHIKKLYSGFFAKPYVNNIGILEKHKGQLRYIEKEIGKSLKSYPNFEGIDFCDVHAGGIQIRGHHKDIKNYCFGEQITIKYDFSNYKDTIAQFVNMWKSLDNDSFISDYKSFLADGEKYGWD